MITWLKINFGQWPDHVDQPNKCLRCHISTFLTGQNKEKKVNSWQSASPKLSVTWSSLAVCEYMSFRFAKSRQEKGYSSQAETWQVKIYWWKSLTDRSNVTFSWFPWQHEGLNTTCDLLATTFSTVHRSTHTHKKIGMISQHSITGTILSQPFVFACAFP